jgi:XTP/dITP diphosphohydrolase
VETLGGKPGLHSARFSGKPGATDADRRAYLLDKLKGHPRPWPAAFRSTVVIATPDGQIFTLDGECRGEIIPEERGSNGFGYDPIFLVEGLGRTMAELSMEEKNRLSHRARAILAAKPVLLDLLKSN